MAAEWTEKENDFLINNYQTMTDSKITAGLLFILGIDRSKNSVSKRLSRLGLSRRKARRETPKTPQISRRPVKMRPIERILISRKKLITAMGEDHSIKSISKASRISENDVRGMVTGDGVPERYADRVKRVLGMVG